MKVRPALMVCLLGLAMVMTGRAMQRVEQRTFTLPSDGTVKIDAYRGMINVVPGEGPNVQITVRSVSNHDSETKDRTALDALELNLKQVGRDILVQARNPRETGVLFLWDDHSKLEINIEVQVPERCNLDLKTDDGSITVGSLSGHMRARTHVGTIFFRRIDGSVDAQAEDGDVVVSRCSGPVTLKTIRGSVRIGLVGGRAILETVNGDIEVQTAQNVVEARTAEGDITAGFATVAGESRIKTAVGNIVATLNPDAGCSIHAKSLWGKILNHLSVQTESGGNGRSKLVGLYNGGGPRLDLEASGGYVRLEPGEPLFED